MRISCYVLSFFGLCTVFSSFWAPISLLHLKLSQVPWNKATYSVSLTEELPLKTKFCSSISGVLVHWEGQYCAPVSWWLFPLLLHSDQLPVTEQMLQQLCAGAEMCILNFSLPFLFPALDGAEQRGKSSLKGGTAGLEPLGAQPRSFGCARCWQMLQPPAHPALLLCSALPKFCRGGSQTLPGLLPYWCWLNHVRGIKESSEAF